MTTESDRRTEAPAPVVHPHVSLGAVVAIAAVSAFMIVMDGSIVNVALPTMRRDLHLSINGQQWVVDAYLLTLGGFLLLGARAADLYGRKATFQAGLIIFTAASMVGGFAVNGPMLLAARAVQGVGGAMVAPAGLGLILATHHHLASREKALSQYSAAASVAAVAGVIFGGILTEEASWRWVMFVNVPFGCLLVLAVAVTLAPAAEYHRGPLDLAGAATITIGASSLTYGVSQAPTEGWGSTGVVVALAVAAGLIAGFVFIESRAEQPLVRLSVFRLRNLDIGNVVVGCFGVCLTGSTFFLSLIFQSTLEYSALRTGAAMVPLGVAMAVTSIGSARLVLWFGARQVLVAGAAISACGCAWFAALPDQPRYAEDLLGPIFVVGAGLGLMMMPSARAATSGIPPHEAGLASGLLSMSRQLGAAVGLAALVTLASSMTQHRLAGHTAKAVELHGFRGALLGTAGFAALAAIVALFLRGESLTDDTAPTPVVTEF